MGTIAYALGGLPDGELNMKSGEKKFTVTSMT
jgi:hypothetical protein